MNDAGRDLTFTYLNNVELRMVSDEGLEFLIAENSAKIKVLTEQNERLKEELFWRKNENLEVERKEGQNEA